MASHPKRKGSQPRGAKKNGGGGKFTWGKEGELVELGPLSRGDPLFDPELDEEEEPKSRENREATKVAQRVGIDTKKHRSGFAEVSTTRQDHITENHNHRNGDYPAEMSLAEYKRKVEEALREFFKEGDLQELYNIVEELEMPFFRYEVVKKAITQSLDLSDREREMASQMLNEFYGNVFSMEQIGKGFERILESLEDVRVDVPDVDKLLPKFLARAVADEILPPAFLSDPVVEKMGGSVVQQAKVLLSIKHGAARLEKVWGTSALASVEELKSAVAMLIEEYLDSEDKDEATECLKTMDVQHFHHEVIKRAMVLGMDKGERERVLVIEFFEHLTSVGLLTTTQLTKGINRVYTNLEDLKLDVPEAETFFYNYISKCIEKGLLSENFSPSIEEGSPVLAKSEE
eukprot:gb/GECG01016337.1/.p1 GENE.gb/GECG01016337.1/~~gb/GECG01016337.1/.p1  ORF type:complete len:403 (+),score=72.79 gb/GECG01016337.1/:1-1209(+)